MQLKSCIFFFIIHILVIGNLFSQIKGFSPMEPEKLFQEESVGLLDKEQMLQKETLPLGSTIVPEHYKLGPGDVLAIQNLTSSINYEYVKVTPENSILLKRIGEISLKGKNLAEARKLIIDEIKKRNPGALIYVALFQPRMVMVSISGNVLKEGTYLFPASYKVSSALKIANLVESQNLSEQQIYMSYLKVAEKPKFENNLRSNSGLPVYGSYSMRNISVSRDDGSVLNMDLEKASALNDVAYDCYVMENDKIFVPFEPKNYDNIVLAGEFIMPGKYCFKRGDKLSSMVKLGLGLKIDADPDDITLFKSDGGKVKIKLDSSLNLISEDFELTPGSIIVASKKSYSGKINYGIAAVSGMVNKPGVFPIIPGKTNLKDIIELAGGFNNDACLSLSYILRKNNRNISRFNPSLEAIENFQYSDITMEDTTRYNIDQLYKKPIVSCDFEDLFENGNDNQNVILEDGDLIVIPETPKTVFVYGQVNRPGYVQFEKNKNIEWYITKAGGFAVNASKARARIIRANNKVWTNDKDNTIVKPGDEIYVPRPPDLPPGVELQSYSLIATAVTTAISLTYLIITLFRK